MKTIKKLNIAFLSIFFLACATGAPKQSSSNIPQQEPTTVTAAPTTSQTPTTTQAPQPTTELTSDEALEIALKDAGVRKEEVTITKTSIDMDHGVKKHEFEFYSGNVEYEYDINALTGEIVSKSTKRYMGNTATASNTGPLTQEQALQVALQHANVTEKDIALLKTELDYEHGKEVFEFEFYVGNVEYNYTIDTSTGEIIEYEIGD